MADPNRDSPGVIALPPLIFLVAIVVGTLIHFSWPFLIPVPVIWRWVAGAVIVACVVLATWARTTFTRAGTNVNPHLPSTALVEAGPFRFTRNPMYVAMSVALIALAFATRVGWFLVLTVPVCALIHWGVVLREERYLAHKFGEPYNEYRQRVRRYL
jgi:protein-S-isoprenylcysteine O-methyltransferase Ste14